MGGEREDAPPEGRGERSGDHENEPGEGSGERDEGPGESSGGRESGGSPGEKRERPRTHAADASLHSDALPDAVPCPHCGETDSEQFSAFGSAVSVSQYYCRSCRTVFETFKWR